MEFEAGDSSEYFLEKRIQGRLIFQNTKNASLSVAYYVYDVSDVDSEFEEKIMDWLFIQSCLTFIGKETRFTSASFKGFYYLLKPCHNCHVEQNRDCKNLASQINSIMEVPPISRKLLKQLKK